MYAKILKGCDSDKKKKKKHQDMEMVEKANPYRNKDGTFASAPGGKGGGSLAGDMGAVKPKISASSVSVGGEDRYAFNNGKKPSGSGNWLFSPNTSIDWSKNPKAGEDYFQAPYGATYGDAKKQAKAWAASKGKRSVNVMS